MTRITAEQIERIQSRIKLCFQYTESHVAIERQVMVDLLSEANDQEREIERLKEQLALREEQLSNLLPAAGKCADDRDAALAKIAELKAEQSNLLSYIKQYESVDMPRLETENASQVKELEELEDESEEDAKRIASLESQLAIARASALEDAAKVAESLPTLKAYFPGIEGTEHRTIHGEAIAAAIRALAKPKGEAT